VGSKRATALRDRRAIRFELGVRTIAGVRKNSACRSQAPTCGILPHSGRPARAGFEARGSRWQHRYAWSELPRKHCFEFQRAIGMHSTTRTNRRVRPWRTIIMTMVAAVSTLGSAPRARAMPIPFMYAGIPVIPDPSISMSGISQPFWGWAGGPPSIRINPDHWAIMPEGTQQFLLDHERG